jgi:hypothetical protein
MFKHVTRKLAIGLTLAALVTPVAFASSTSTEPEPGVVHIILVFFGLA